MNKNLESKIKPESLTEGTIDKDGIFVLLNKEYINNDNEKYMKMRFPSMLRNIKLIIYGIRSSIVLHLERFKKDGFFNI